jgi:phytoene dehydrogenase-like protein
LRRVFGRLASEWSRLAPDILGPVVRIPSHPLLMARFGARALWPAAFLARQLFKRPESRALLAGMSAHSMVPLGQPLTASFGLVLGASGHALGWHVAKGGSQAITDAMVAYLRCRGTTFETNRRVASLDDLPPARAVFLDVMPRAFVDMAGWRLSEPERRRMEGYEYGPGVFKLDYALSGPVPWRAEACRRAGTVHVAGRLPEIVASEYEVGKGRHPERPFVLVAQQSLIDSSRAPAGKHTFWAYCHVPNGSTFDMTERIEAQVERFAPGFRDLILARSVRFPADLQQHNPNLIGGDIGAGDNRGMQLFFRPKVTLHPYRTAVPGVYLCSAATPPGGGVHGICGFHAARDALGRELR